MKKDAVLGIIGLLLMMLAGTLLLPLLVAYLYDSKGEIPAFWEAIAISFGCGLALFLAFGRRGHDLGGREGFAIVAFGWFFISLFGALPFWLAEGGIPSFVDAFFETMSGLTTTGASILNEPEALPPGLLFWRSFTHWLGGMGIVVLTVAILPFLGAGGYQLVRAEVPGPTADKLQPRIAETAKTLWLVYLLLTLVQILLLLPAMDLFDASCHAFGTLATGGFSTENASVAAYDSIYVDSVIMLFMFLAGANFVLHYHALSHGKIRHLFDSEFRLYLAFILVPTLLITINLLVASFPEKELHPEKYDGFWSCMRYSLFQVLSMLTTTGYGTADFDRWPNLCRLLLVLLMFCGGCAGSTAGGIKCIRIVVLIRFGIREVRHLARPQAVLPVKVGGESVDREVVSRVMGFFALYILIFALSFIAMVVILQPVDPVGASEIADNGEHNSKLLAAFGTVIATVGNIGPGIAEVGPTNNFGWIPDSGKLLLTFLMLLGRLEIYSVLVVLLPIMWRR